MTARARAAFDPESLLDAVPTPNAAVRVERRGDALVLWVPLRQRWWTRGVCRWLLPLRTEKGYALDALGQEVWAACDGDRSLERIVEDFARRHRLRFHEARVAVLTFLRTLVERRLVALVGPAEAGAPARGPPAGEGAP